MKFILKKLKQNWNPTKMAVKFMSVKISFRKEANYI